MHHIQHQPKNVKVKKFSVKIQRETFKEILYKAIEEDYPKNWPNLVEIALERMHSAQKTEELYASLTVIKMLISAYQFRMGQNREPLMHMIKEVFPTLENLLGNQLKSWDEQSTKICLVIMECFKLANYLEIDEYFRGAELEKWMIGVKKLLEVEIREELMEKVEEWGDILERQDTDEWKLKIICGEIIVDWIRHSKYPSSVNSSRTQEIKQDFLKKFSPGFLDTCFNYLKYYTRTYIAPKMVALCVEAVNQGIQNEFIHEALNCHFEMILLEICLPLLALNKQDEDYWENEPREFIYSEEYTSDDHNIIKNAAKELILVLLRYKNKEGGNLTVDMLNFLAYSFKEGKDARTGEPLNTISKEYMLRGMEIASDRFLSDMRIVDSVEEIVENVVIPELEADQPVLRARACSVLSKFGGVTLSNRENYMKICQSVCQNLMHTDLPVKIKASKAMSTVLVHDEVKELMLPELKKIIENVLKMMQQIDLSSLVKSLEGIIESFGDCMGELATGLIKTLAENFEDCHKEVLEERKKMDLDEGEDEVTETMKAAESLLDTITNILKAKLPDKVYRAVTPTVLDLLNMSLLAGDKYCIEKCFSFLNIVLYKSEEITDEMVFYYPIMIYFITGRPTKEIKLNIKNLPKIFQDILTSDHVFGAQFDNFESMMGCFLNFIGKLGENFLTSSDIYGISFVELLFEMIRKIGNECLQRNNNADLCLALRLIIALIENFRGKIDDLIPQILDLSTELMKENRTENLKSVLIQIICMMFWYDPIMAIELLNKRDYTQDALEAWFGNVEIFTSDFEKERELYGIAGIISLPADLYPKSLNLEAVSKEILKVSTEIVEIRGNIFKEKKDDELEFVGIDRCLVEGEEEDEPWDEDDVRFFF